MTATDTATRTESAIGVPWRSPALVAILAATLMTPMDVPMISPALPEARSVFGVSESRAGLLITVYALPGILLAPLVGALADRIGRRYVLSACLALFGLAGTSIAFTNDFTVALGPALFTLAGGAVGYQSTLLGASVVAALFTAVLALAPLDP